MASHLECIGIIEEPEFVEFLERASQEGRAAELEHDGFELVWRDESGASVAANFSGEGELECSRPSFDAQSSIDVIAKSFAEDRSCRYCSRLVVEVFDEEEMAYPLAVELERIGAALAQVAEGDRGRVAVTAFAESFESWSDEESYQALQGERPALAAQSLIPTGTFLPDLGWRRILGTRKERVPTAEALITGLVRAWEVRRNSVTGHEFVHGLIDSFGATYDVVASLEDAPAELDLGSVVQGNFWLIARYEG